MLSHSADKAVNDDTWNLLGNETINECTGIDIFKVASLRDARDGFLEPSSSGDDGGRRSLEVAYVSNPDLKLSNIDEKTLGFAGEAVKQVVLEATYGFLQKCIPVSDRQRVWNQILGRANLGEWPDVTCITVPEGILDLKKGLRPLSHLIGNCIKVLSQNFSVHDQKSLKLIFSRGVALCDALNDGKRKRALEVALHSLTWLMLGLDSKSMEVYRHANQELDRINAKYSDLAGKGAISIEEVSNARDLEEHDLLESMKSTFEKSKEPFRVNFVESLQRLLATEV